MQRSGLHFAKCLPACLCFGRYRYPSTVTSQSSTALRATRKRLLAYITSLLVPMQANIGLLYFKATVAVVRCVYNWVWSMRVTAADDPMLWDQVRSEDGHLHLS